MKCNLKRDYIKPLLPILLIGFTTFGMCADVEPEYIEGWEGSLPTKSLNDLPPQNLPFDGETNSKLNERGQYYYEKEASSHKEQEKERARSHDQSLSLSKQQKERKIKKIKSSKN